MKIEKFAGENGLVGSFIGESGRTSIKCCWLSILHDTKSVVVNINNCIKKERAIIQYCTLNQAHHLIWQCTIPVYQKLPYSLYTCFTDKPFSKFLIISSFCAIVKFTTFLLYYQTTWSREWWTLKHLNTMTHNKKGIKNAEQYATWLYWCKRSDSP